MEIKSLMNRSRPFLTFVPRPGVVVAPKQVCKTSGVK